MAPNWCGLEVSTEEGRLQLSLFKKIYFYIFFFFFTDFREEEKDKNINNKRESLINCLLHAPNGD